VTAAVTVGIQDAAGRLTASTGSISTKNDETSISFNSDQGSLLENQALIDRVCLHFVFMGDPEEADRSAVLASLREDQ
jgi:hypothetical protein